MLHRSIPRSLGNAVTSRPCATCICRCGRRFLPGNQPIANQRRRRSNDVRSASPAVYRDRTKSARVLSAAEKKEQQLQEESEHDWHLRNIERAAKLDIISTDRDTVIGFLNDFAALCDETRLARLGAIPVNKEKLERLIAERNVSEHDCEWMAHVLLLSPKQDQNVYGKKLLYALSHLGSERATIRIMKQALVEARHYPAKLKAREIQQAAKHLGEVAARGHNYRATVLEGKVQLLLGNQNAAISLWTDAMAAAVAHAEEFAAMKARREKPPDDHNKGTGANHQDLDTPWIELSSIHIARKEWAKAKWAINIGCEMDDPTSHYHAATFEKKTDESGELAATSAWLYHMTKAAASGHPRAAHELGYFYGNSLWPYLEDEPPDHVKPTAFDKYPAEDPTLSNKSGLLGRIQRALGSAPASQQNASDCSANGDSTSLASSLRQFVGVEPRKREDPIVTVFKTAHFPSDPVGRMRMAIEWLHIAGSKCYAPAHLLSAHLRLEKTLWAEVSAPRAALDLSDERYTYASKADYDAGVPIEKPEKNDDVSENEISNPFYSPDIAYEHVRQIFHAETAQRAQMELNRGVARLKKSGSKFDPTDMEALLTENGMEGWQMERRELPAQARVFFRFPEVREMYSDDKRGMIYDDTGPQLIDLAEAAKEICEEQGWDMYDEGGELMYKYGIGKAKPIGGR